MMDFWVVFAVLAALAGASNALVNEYFKVHSIYLLFWLRLIMIPCMALGALQFPPPSDPVFYVAIAGTALIFSYFDLVYFAQAAQAGAGTVTRFAGIIVGLTFLVWLVVDPALLITYLDNPLRFAGITAALAGGIYFGLKMRRCDVSMTALKKMGPAIMLAVMGDVLAKIAMLHADQNSAVWYYAFVQTALVFLICLAVLHAPYCARRFGVPVGLNGVFNKRVVMAALCLAAGWMVHMISKYYAIWTVENPAYVTIIGLTAPLWVSLAYRAVKRRETADIGAGFGVVACAALLVVFTRL